MTEPTADPWIHKSDLIHARAGHDTAAASDSIFVVGGFGADAVLGFLEEYPRQGPSEWNDRPAMPTRRTNAAAAALNGLVYVAGGRDRADRPLRKVEVYDPEELTWADGIDLPDPRAQAAAAGLGGVIYVAGGFVEEHGKLPPSNSVLALIPGGVWTPRAPMPTARARLRLVAAGEYLYAIGGQDATGATVPAVERYSPADNAWTTQAPMHHDRGLPGVVAIARGPRPRRRHFIVVIGGAHATTFQVAQNFQDTTEVYDVELNTWFELPIQLPQAKAGLTAAELTDGRIVVAGGLTFHDGVTSDVQATIIHHL